MRTTLLSLGGAILLASAANVLAAVRYVDQNSANPTPPYTNWATAAAIIQDAVDAAVSGDEIVVTNGIYASGGRVTVGDSTTNRVVVGKPLSLRSVNGPQFTAIDGGASVRCVYLTNGASLSGFALTNGRAQIGGGLWCESANAVVSNCVVSGNSSVGHTISVWVGSPCCDLQQPVPSAGGVYGGTLYDCTLSGNRAETASFTGFPCDYSTCTGVGRDGIETYYWLGAGGGAANATLNNCTLSANWAGYGGGAYGCMLNNCTLTGNTAVYSREDGQAYGGGGGAYNSVLNNCIIYFNTAADGPNYDSESTLNYCCTTPQPAGGTGNISADPQLASSSHLSANSPCRGAGSTAYAGGTDIDGETWASSPSIGCDEYHSGSVTGPLSVGITATVTNVVGGFTVQFTASNEGRITGSSWDFGDGTTATNQPYTSHAWTAPGDYAVLLRAYNESHPAGISTTLTVHLGTAVHYVATGSPNPLAPFTSWATAATNIQDAVDAAVAGDEIVVTNGIYATGARVTVRSSNRVVVDKPLIVRSVNGPQFTAVDGEHSMRCVYLAKGASLSGFTLTNGGFANAPQGGGVFGESVAAAVSNCTLSGNMAYFGGGAAGCTLNNCILSENGATGYSRTGDSCVGNGGGAYKATLNNCTLTGNRSCQGGGADSCLLNSCVVTGNSGSGASGCTLNNCTLTGNSGGGAFACTMTNCIAYFNAGPNYDPTSTLNYCCTSPKPASGGGNISSDPLLASSSHLSANSPCRGAGNPADTSGSDIDGEAWSSPPSIGCDEYGVGAVVGPLSVGITATFTNVDVGFTVQFTASIEGQTTANSWDFGDGTTATNEPYTSHAWAAEADYAVVLRAYNESHPAGISTTFTVHVVNAVHYVASGSLDPVAPYTSWATAATNIQDAVNAATVPGALVLVTNGIYAAGTTYDIRVFIDKILTVRSVNGPLFTIIDGGRSNQCVELVNATLSGFTLTNGFSRYGAGGASGGTLNNCIVTGNSGSFPGGAGGGASYCTLNDCALIDNSAYVGGGASYCTLNNCTLTGNSAGSVGGGAYFCSLNNRIVYSNTARLGPNYGSSTLNYCCTTPLPTNGVGNITNAPLFVDRASGNFRLQPTSPCINAGLTAFAPAGPDLDGNPRINGGTVDMGAYEFQSPSSIISYAWLQQYNLPTDGSVDAADPDGDGLNNWQEWRCGTDPTNALSALRLFAPVTEPTNLIVSWQSVSGVTYFLERATNLATPRAFTPLAKAIPGQPGRTTYTDTNATDAGPWFYRVGVSDP